MNLPSKVLIIEDEQDISRILRDYISIHGYEVDVAKNGAEGLRLVDTWHPDFIILDLTLPDVDGIELCRHIRDRSTTPILILSARGSDTDKVLGLGFGADDYMTKPFSLSELVARINAHLRRVERMVSKSTQLDSEVIYIGNLKIDKKAYILTVDNREISLSAKEFELLYFLATHTNQVFTKSQLLDAVWGYTSIGDENTITVYIRRLREKVEVDPSRPIYIRTIWGVGYKLNVDDI